MNIVGIRGATTVRENTEELILLETKSLLKNIMELNKLKSHDIINITFSATSDLNKVYPARAARDMGFTDTPLLCFQEMFVENSLDKCIRVMILCRLDMEKKDVRHVYLNEAKILRPDLCIGEDNLKKTFTIAIDGPAASGKSTIAKKIAEKLNIEYIDSGAMFRAVTLYLLENKTSVEEADFDKIFKSLELDFKNRRMYMNSKDVEDKIRDNNISKNVSDVALNKAVRCELLEIQRKLGKNKSIIMDGRDIGTTVFPDARYKFFLTASVEERARRRYSELKNKGQDVDYASIVEELKTRDHIDSTREISPLKMADDAIKIDTSLMTIDEVVDAIIDHIEEDDYVL